MVDSTSDCQVEVVRFPVNSSIRMIIMIIIIIIIITKTSYTDQFGATDDGHRKSRASFPLFVDGSDVERQHDEEECTRHPDQYRVHEAVSELWPRVGQ